MFQVVVQVAKILLCLLLDELSKSNYIDLLYYRYADDPSYVCPNDNVRVVKEIINSTSLKLKNFLMFPLCILYFQFASIEIYSNL